MRCGGPWFFFCLPKSGACPMHVTLAVWFYAVNVESILVSRARGRSESIYRRRLAEIQ